MHTAITTATGTKVVPSFLADELLLLAEVLRVPPEEPFRLDPTRGSLPALRSPMSRISSQCSTAGRSMMTLSDASFAFCVCEMQKAKGERGKEKSSHLAGSYRRAVQLPGSLSWQLDEWRPTPSRNASPLRSASLAHRIS